MPSEKHDGKGGGAAAFPVFVGEELKPSLGERFGVGSAEYTLYGISLGGLFATWVLLTEPTAFARSDRPPLVLVGRPRRHDERG